MGIKFEEKYIKNKLRTKFGEIEVYNPQFDTYILEELTRLIENNSETKQLENGLNDVKVNNIVQIMRFMLIHLTNFEDNCWNDIDDEQLESNLNLADGDFKEVVNTLLDIMIELGSDIARTNIRKLNILNSKLLEMSESIKANIEIDKTLASFGLDRDKLVKLQQGDEETLKEFQDNLIKKNINKPKRQYNKKKK